MHANTKSFLAKYFIMAFLALESSSAFSQVSLSVGIAPPPLQAYAQPECPGDGYLWTPGYWAYAYNAYYWVPGAWVQPPEVGLLWTPCYWGWGGNGFIYHSGYWGSNVGFYGGINYGYGYGGRGYNGGRWEGRSFSYNRSVNNISSTRIHNTYVDNTAIHSNARSVSYNGGNGGVQAQPTAQERHFASESHIKATSAQRAHVRAASQSATPRVTAVKDGAGAPANGQAKAEVQAPRASQEKRETESIKTAAKPHANAPAARQTRAEPVARAQSRPGAEAKAPSHSQTHAAAQPGGVKSQAH